MFKPAHWVIVTLIVTLVGCGTYQPRPRQSGKSQPVPHDLILTEETPQPTIQPIPPEPPPATAEPRFSLPKEDWVPLGRWARENKAGSLTNLPSNGHPTFGLDTATGQFIVHTGSDMAQWGGLELRLGFAPQLIGEEPFLHRLDIEKNLLPILLSPQKPAPGPRVMVLDPGHGGADSGTRSAKGALEKDYNLDWALRLQPLLIASGWKVFLTRTNDTQLTLTDRVNCAARHKADVFISLHFNAAGLPHHSGIETYCVTPSGMPSSVTRGYDDDDTLVFPNNHYDAQNLQLALEIHRAALRATGGNDRGVRRARFLSVLRGQNCPAVLIEGGYLSNPEEADRIATEEYRQLLAEAVAKAMNE